MERYGTLAHGQMPGQHGPGVGLSESRPLVNPVTQFEYDRVTVRKGKLWAFGKLLREGDLLEVDTSHPEQPGPTLVKYDINNKLEWEAETGKNYVLDPQGFHALAPTERFLTARVIKSDNTLAALVGGVEYPLENGLVRKVKL
jgi:hypothetical protein